MASCNDILTDALEDIGKFTPGETAPASEDLAIALKHYNRLVNRLLVDRAMSTFETSQSIAFGSSAQSYTIGPSGSLFTVTTRPPKITKAKLVLVASTPDFERELPVIEVQRYSDIPDPDRSAPEPERLYYQATFPNGTLWPHPYPTTTSNKLKVYYWTQLGQVALADITTDIDMPPAFQDVLTTKLSVRLCVPFKIPVPAELKIQEHAASQLYSSMNIQPSYIGTDIRGHNTGGAWDAQQFRTLGL